MITKETLERIDLSIENLNRIYFASFDLSSDERKKFNATIEQLQGVREEIKLQITKN